MRKKVISVIISFLMVVCMMPGAAFAEAGGTTNQAAPATPSPKAVRTVMLYVCGSDLETDSGMATFNLMQVLNSNFSKDGSVRFIVMTGGSDEWQMDSDSLCAADGTPIEEVSCEYNQLWEAKGQDAPKGENPGKMVLLDGDGITGAEGEAVASEDELMSEPETLKAFINYCHENYPAEKYDLILWDHGGGPNSGFGIDEHSEDGDPMPFVDLMDAFSDNAVTRDGGKFDFVDFDACLMSSVELDLAFAQFTDYYIASPESEPGYGQDYEGWLNMVGEDPNCDTYKLGKKIVDDFYEFYEYGEGMGQNGTLAVIDTRKLLDSDLIPAINELSDKLREQLTEPDPDLDLYAYYDELYSSRNAIAYGSTPGYCDFGNLTAMLGANNYETSLADIERDEDVRNEYAGNAERFDEIFADEDMMYARGTSGIKGDPQMIRKKSGLKVEELQTSGMYIFFPDSKGITMVHDYIKAMNEVFANSDEDAEVTKCLKKYLQVVIDYSIMMRTGKAVATLLEPDKEATELGIKAVPRNEITYDKVMELWKTAPEGMTEFSDWESNVKEFFENRNGGEEGAREWLTALVKQQAAEAVDRTKVTANKVLAAKGNKYQVTINETGRRVIDTVSQEVICELPVLEEYKDSLPEGSDDRVFVDIANVPLGKVKATTDFDVDLSKSGDDLIKDIIRWNLGDVSKWNIDPIQEKWYAVKTADNKTCVASIYSEDEDYIIVPTLTEDDEVALMGFIREDGSLESIAILQGQSDGLREIDPSNLKGKMTLKPVVYYNLFGMVEKYYPISRSDITISADNFDKIKLIYTDVANIPDIGDIDGDGEVLKTNTVITDIYGNDLDITDKVRNPEKTLTSLDKATISKATISTATYSKSHKGAYEPTFKVDGKTLVEGKDFEYILRDKYTKPGKYYLSIEGIGDYTDGKLFEYIIKKAANPLKLKAKTIKVKRSAIKKKVKTLKVTKAIKFVTKGAGKVTYKKVSGNKKITINKKTGKVTIKKGLKKGTYKIKVKATAAGNGYYKAKSQKVTIKVKVQ